MCGLEVTLNGRAVERVAGDPRDPFSRGHVCPKAVGLADIHHDPDRLKQPVRRRGSSWETIGWDEAFDFVAARVTALQAEHGQAAVATYTGNPAVHNYGSVLHGQLLTAVLRTPNGFSATSLDQLPHMLASLKMFGHQLWLPVPDIDRTQLMVIVGANPAVSNGSLMSAGNAKAGLKAIRARGGRVVVIDPRLTETARLADTHLFIRPGTDAALFAGLAHHILFAREPRLGRIAPYIRGLDALKSAMADFSPDRVAPATGIGADRIRALADDLLDAPSAVLYGRVGICTQRFGGLAGWLLNVVNAVCGRLDTPGGWMFPTPAVDIAGLAGRIGKRGSYATRVSRVRGWPEFGGEFPTSTLADEILTPGDGQVRGLITSAGNPVLSSPDGERLAEALRSLSFMASVDIYINETTRHADIILPPTFGLEHDHYDVVLYALAVRNAAKYSPAAWPRDAGQRHDWEIYTELARRIAQRRPKSSSRTHLTGRWSAPVTPNASGKGTDAAADAVPGGGPPRLGTSWALATAGFARAAAERLGQAALDSVLGLIGRTDPAGIINMMLRGGPIDSASASSKRPCTA